MLSEEIEIKLHLPAEQANRFRRSALLRRHKLARASTSRLVSTYFDTPKLQLRKKGMALRIRRVGHVLEQTLKWNDPNGAGLQRRREFNHPVANDLPDLDVIQDAGVRGWLHRRGMAKALQEVFVTDIRRTKWPVYYDGAQIEVALDEGELRAGKGSSPVSEIELELVSGDPAALLDLAMAISSRLDVTLDHGSKASRGYALFEGAQARPVKGTDPALAGDMTLWAAFGAFMGSGVRQLVANAPVVLQGSDPEGVHQARVAVRRMRAALALFKPVLAEGPQSDLRRELRWLQQELGPARDWDVFIVETFTPLRRRAGASAALDRLANSAEDARQAGYTRAAAAISSRRFTSCLLRLEKWLLEGENDCRSDATLPEFAGAVLDRRRRRVLKMAGKSVITLPEESLHALRIELKKLRYAASFFQALYGRARSKAYLKTLAGLQDCLGSLNDAVVQGQLLAELEGRGQAADPEAVAMLTGWRAAHIDRGMSRLSALWKTFSGTGPFWK